MARQIEIVTYNPEWPAIYEQEANHIKGVLAGTLVTIHHIGSTAIPGLSAKPTIDLLLVVTMHTVLDAKQAAMRSLGYQPKGEHGLPGRRYFVKSAGEVHLFHLHAFERGHPEIDRHLDFRDYLRTHPAHAEAYRALKQDLVKQFSQQPQAYTRGKETFIRKIDRLAAQGKTSAP